MTQRIERGSNTSSTESPTGFVRVIAAVATLGALLFGYDTGVISGALPFMELSPDQGGLGLTPLTEGLVTSSLVFGAVFGGNTFFVLAVVNIATLVFLVKYLPETRGRTLESLEEKFRRDHASARERSQDA